MKYGVCTNQPSLCRRAATRDLMPMPAPDTRCPEPGCGKPLLPAPGGGTTTKRAPSMGVTAVAVALIVVGAGGYFLYQRNEKTSVEPAAPVAQPATVSPTPQPVQQPVVEIPQNKPQRTTESSVTPGSAAPAHTPAATIAPSPPKSEPRPVVEMRKSADRCNQTDWAAASCDMVRQCWEPESPRLSSCEGLGPKACSHIKMCLGVVPADVGPGVKN